MKELYSNTEYFVFELELIFQFLDKFRHMLLFYTLSNTCKAVCMSTGICVLLLRRLSYTLLTCHRRMFW